MELVERALVEALANALFVNPSCLGMSVERSRQPSELGSRCAPENDFRSLSGYRAIGRTTVAVQNPLLAAINKLAPSRLKFDRSRKAEENGL
jgi:hypothetical protein